MVDIVDATEVVIVALSEPLRWIVLVMLMLMLIMTGRLDLRRINAELGLSLGDLRSAR